MAYDFINVTIHLTVVGGVGGDVRANGRWNLEYFIVRIEGHHIRIGPDRVYKHCIVVD